MQKEKFYSEIAEILETDEKLSEDTNLRDLEEYDSMSVLALIAFIDEHFNKKLAGAEFRIITTVKSLMEKIGYDHFK